MIQRAVMIAVVGALFGCAKPTDRPRLTAAAATEIADRKAEEFRPNRLGDYTRTPALYDPEEDAWWVSYSPKHPEGDPSSRGFSIQVNDKTGEAVVWLP